MGRPYAVSHYPVAPSDSPLCQEGFRLRAIRREVVRRASARRTLDDVRGAPTRSRRRVPGRNVSQAAPDEGEMPYRQRQLHVDAERRCRSVWTGSRRRPASVLVFGRAAAGPVCPAGHRFDPMHPWTQRIRRNACRPIETEPSSQRPRPIGISPQPPPHTMTETSSSTIDRCSEQRSSITRTSSGFVPNSVSMSRCASDASLSDAVGVPKRPGNPRRP